MKYQYDFDIKDDFIEMLQIKNDFSGQEELKNYLNLYQSETDIKKRSLIKFCIYKLSKELLDTDLNHFDCDSSKEVVESFKNTYGWLQNFEVCHQNDKNGTPIEVKYQLINDNMSFRGDTMTSAWTVFKEYIKLKTSTYKIEQNDFWQLYMLRKRDEIVLSDDASEFLNLNHTIGNFIPVPKGFNTGRNNFGKWDSWDLTMKQMYQWYMDNKSSSNIDNSSLEKLFETASNKQSAINHCQAWLQNFSTWDNFVEENYLQAFIMKNGIPKMFFEKHSFDYPLPKDINKFEDFFKNVNECIKQRSNDIINGKRFRLYT